PGAVTTRFQHSIGVMHVASKLTYQLFESVDQRILVELFPGFKGRTDRSALVETVRLGALLHDVGHGPFSHALEDIMRATLSQSYKTEFEKAKELFAVTDQTQLAAHEYYSYKLINTSEISDLISKTTPHIS